MQTESLWFGTVVCPDCVQTMDFSISNTSFAPAEWRIVTEHSHQNMVECAELNGFVDWVSGSLFLLVVPARVLGHDLFMLPFCTMRHIINLGICHLLLVSILVIGALQDFRVSFLFLSLPYRE